VQGRVGLSSSSSFVFVLRALLLLRLLHAVAAANFVFACGFDESFGVFFFGSLQKTTTAKTVTQKRGEARRKTKVGDAQEACSSFTLTSLTVSYAYM
jgi:hypothetical protein